MANNEEKRILVLEADESNLNQFIFDSPWVHLDKIKGNEISRAEAVERMKKAICKELHVQCHLCVHAYDKEKCEEFLKNSGFRDVGEIALDVLLEAQNER